MLVVPRYETLAERASPALTKSALCADGHF
jgi:hypothetical protein